MDADPGSSDEVGSSSQAVGAELAGQAMLAEYAALRAEFDRRANVQWNVFALQITSAGVIASLALSHVSDVALLLAIPLSSYMLGSRYILHDYHLKLISRYVRDSLSERLGDNLAWESWKISQTKRDVEPRRWLTPTGWEYAASHSSSIRGGSVACAVYCRTGRRIQLADHGSRRVADTRICVAVDSRRVGYLFPAQVVQ
jgi:hypothetical protein